MKLRPIDFLWKQLNGPQATGIIQGIFTFFQESLQPTLDYLYQLGVDKASNQHLNFFGAILGIPRPLVWNTDSPYWSRWFRVTDDEVMSDQGFSDPDNPLLLGIGGLLSYEYEEYFDPERVPIDISLYRAILQAVTKGDCDVGSLILLDRFVSIFFAPAEYTITQPGTLNPGDTLVNLTRLDEVAYIALLALVKLWLPNTHVIINMEA